MVNSLADVVFEMYPGVFGSAFDLAKFGIVEKEESDRRVIGLSAANKCIVLADMTEGTRNESEKTRAKFVPRGTSCVHWNVAG